MSYSLEVTAPRSGIAQALRDEAVRHLQAMAPGPLADATAEHVSEAVTAVEHAAHVVGGPDSELTVSVSGHANPGHGDGPAESLTFTIRAT